MTDLFIKLKRLKIDIDLVDGRLDISAPKGVMTKEILDEIKSNKQQVIEFITAYKGKKKNHHRIPKAEPAPFYELSFAQKRMWILSQFEEARAAYNMSEVYVLKGALDREVLENCFKALIERHEVLRTAFKEDAHDEVRQYIIPSGFVDFKLDNVDLSAADDQQAKIKELVQRETTRPFDLSSGRLVRALVIKIKPEEYAIVYVMHHIISDSWSMGVLFKELFILYNAAVKKQAPALQDLEIHYKDYAAWQQAQLSGDELNRHKAYWTEKFKSGISTLNLPADKPRPSVKTYNGAIHRQALTEQLSLAFKEMSRHNDSTLFMNLLSVVNVFLFRYTGQTDLIVGSPIAGRDHVDLEEQIGLYVNTLALRTTFDADDSYKQVLSKVRQTTLDAYEHQVYPFDELVEELSLQRDPSRNVLFDTMVVLQNAVTTTGATETIRLGELDISGYDGREYQISKFDLTFNFIEGKDRLHLHLEYNTDLFETATIQAMSDHLTRLMQAIVDAPDRKISELDILSTKEKEELLDVFNATAAAYPEASTITELFEQQVDKTPHRTALIHKSKSYTYREVNEQANKIASWLRKNYDTRPDELIAIKLDKSERLLFSVLGVLKSGAAYVPVDPQAPPSRIRHMMEEGSCKLLIDEETYRLMDSDAYAHPAPNPLSISKPSHLAYVIYTSGSTGTPKGVLIEHRSLVARITAELRLLSAYKDITTCLTSNYVFDVSLLELFMPLVSGGRLVIPSQEESTIPDELGRLIISEGINVMQGAPGFIHHFFTELSEPQKADVGATLRQLCIGGESLPKALGEWLKSNVPQINVNNHYGPTETTIDAIVSQNIHESGVNTIGKPIDNTQAYILDHHRQLVPVGVVGELYIGGPGVSRGYLNNPDLTQAKFISNPYRPDDTIYASGDLARWLRNGTIEYIGRKDEQLKIRGYRIEPGEIEHAILKQANITNVSVNAKANADGEKVLIAYVVGPQTINAAKLREELSRDLPAYMIPAHVVQVPKIPLTVNGKVDKAALPDPEELETDYGSGYVAPRNKTEIELSELWAEILNKKNIGINDEFFASGGHSMSIIKLKSRIKKRFHTDIPVAKMFQLVNIEMQAKFILGEESHQRLSDRELDQLGRSGKQNEQSVIEKDIAVIGMSVKFPGANTVEEFWENLKNKVESIRFFNDEELREAGIEESLIKNPDYVKANAYIEEKEYFDSSFFGYLPDEAKLMDPQTRMFHESVWSALENAGYNPDQYKGLIGLYAGASANFNWSLYASLTGASSVDSYTAGCLRDRDFMNSLISYKLNLRGPVKFINTACSTSLVAIHTACKGLLDGECSMALAGGVKLNAAKKAGYIYQKGMIKSSDGHNRTFDAASSGTVSGEGAGIVVLKRLSEAIADGDHIFGVIKGSAINNDGGRKVGFTAPSVDGQTDVIKIAHKIAGVDSKTIGYMEAHGTATNLGDPIEIEALNQAFRQSDEKSCAIGSVKTNIGHLDTAAGVAGFIKAVLAVYHRQIPASLHYNKANPNINFKDGPFYVNTELKNWDSDQPLRAGISSFGIGGTNAHVIIEEAPRKESTEHPKGYHLLTLSAKTPGALSRIEANLLDFLEKNPHLPLADIAWTLNKSRSSFNYRKMLVADSLESVVHRLKSSPDQLKTKKLQKESRTLVFMFSGQGSQYVDMGRGLYESEPSFKKEIDRLFHIASTITGVDYREIVFPSLHAASERRIDDTENTQPVLFMLEYALARQLQDYGIKPDVMIGHSLGEYVAACISGVMSLEEAIQLVALRGRLIQSLPAGSMLSVQISTNDIEDYLSPKINMAAANSPDQYVLSGDPAEMETLKEHFKTSGHHAALLHTSHAFHSYMLDAILEEFRQALEAIHFKDPLIPYISNVTGELMTAQNAKDPGYWLRHLREPVQFSKGIKKLLEYGRAVFIEIGPGTTLSSFVRQHNLDAGKHHVINTIRHIKELVSDQEYWFNSIGKLWLDGIDLNWNAIHQHKSRNTVAMPSYSFEKIKYPLGEELSQLISQVVTKPVEQTRQDFKKWFYRFSWKKSGLTNKKNKLEDTFLVFGHKDAISEMLREQIISDKGRLTEVRIGAGFKKLADGVFEISPDSFSDYERLVDELMKADALPDRIIHLWNTDDSGKKEHTLAEIAFAQKTGYHSLLNIAKAIARKPVRQTLKLDVVVTHVFDVYTGERVAPEKSTVLAAVQLIPVEYQNMESRLIDIKTDQALSFMDQLLKELRNKDGKDQLIAIRGYDSWTRIIEPVLPEDSTGSNTSITSESICLITGGAGGIGFTLAKHLYESYGAKLILTGRSALSPEKQKEIESWEGHAVYLQADISDEEAMRLALSRVEKDSGRINAIIHAAGVPDFSGTIDKRATDKPEEIFQPKLYGTLVLEKLAKERAVNFFAICSSLSSVIPSTAQAGYMAANIFEDAFACRMKYETGINVVSISWDTWKEVGMAVEAVKKIYTHDYQSHLRDGITNREGIRIFEQALASGVPHLIVSTTDLNHKLSAPLSAITEKRLEQELPAHNQLTEFDDPEFEEARTSTEKALCELFQEFFGVAGIGRDADFFELGGDSLKAMTITGKIHRDFGVEIPVAELFKNRTVKELSAFMDAQAKKEFEEIALAPVNIVSYPVSPAQSNLWAISHATSSNIAYNMSEVYVLNGELKQDVLEKSFRELIKRHEILRTNFKSDDTNQVRQYIDLHQQGFNISYKDFRHLSDTDQELQVRNSVKEDISKPFNLSADRLLRVSLFHLETDRYVIVHVMHHIISDGWSMNVLIKELLVLYNAFLKNEDNPLPPLRLHYKDYVEWLLKALNSEHYKKEEAYWLEQLSGTLPVLELPQSRMRPALKTYHGGVMHQRLDSASVRGLKSLVKASESTLFMGLVAVLNTLFYRYTFQEDIILGTSVAGRDHADLENQIGYYTKTIALRTRFSGQESFRKILGTVKQVTLESFTHRLYQINDLVKKLDLKQDASRNPIFDVMVVLQNTEMEKTAERSFDGLQVSGFNNNQSVVSKFDLTFSFVELGHDMAMSIEYNSDLFDRETVEQLAGHFGRILNSVAEHPDIAICRLDFLSQAEKQQQLIGFNDTTTAYPKDKSIVQLFEEQVQACPGKTAFICSGRQFTYNELNAVVNQFAAYLTAEKNLLKGDVVCIKLERSEWLLIAILATLKSAGVYVPVNINDPEARIESILEETRCKLVIDESLIRDFGLIRNQYAGENPGHAISATDLAYILYTTGSTGSPKGVMVQHRAVVRLVCNTNYFDPAISTKLLSTGAVTFDATTFEYWSMLLNGGCLVFCDQKTLLNPGSLKELIDAEAIDTMWMTSGWLNQLTDHDISLFKPLKVLLAGGDVLSPAHIHKLQEHYPGLSIINGYGPTENTTFSTTYAITGSYSKIPIGAPISNSQVYILSKEQALMPLGVLGEIYVGGDGLALGYLNNPELTAEKFIRNPYAPNERMYKTGDLGRWLPNGTVEFAGREDNQVKIRGFRIELSEIEAALTNSHTGSEAAVVAKTNEKGEKYLVAYITGEAIPEVSALRLSLSRLLPAYMIPSVYVHLPAFPLNVNGKTDKKMLPDHKGIELKQASGYQAAANETEVQLLEIWSEVLSLNKEDIGVHTSFFELGGHSLKIIQLISRIGMLFGVDISYEQIYEYNTVSELAGIIQRTEKSLFKAILPVAKQEYYDVSHAQKRLWITCQFEEAKVAYNMLSSYTLLNDDVGLLPEVLRAMMERNEILRTSFHVIDHKLVQKINKTDDVEIDIKFIDLSRVKDKSELLKSVSDEFERVEFDLEKAPLFKVGCIKADPGFSLIFLAIHHIISDGWTMTIIRNEFAEIISALKNGQVPAAKEIQYKDFVQWHHEKISDGKSEKYWLHKLSGNNELIRLPYDYTSDYNTFKGRETSFNVSLTDFHKLQNLASQQKTSVSTVLLTLFKILLSKTTRQEHITVAMASANRIHKQLENMMGFFVNILVIKSVIKAEDDFYDILKAVHSDIVMSQKHEDYPFDLLVEKLNPEREQNKQVLFNIMYNYINYDINSSTPQGERSTNDQAAVENNRTNGLLSTSKFDLTNSVFQGPEGLKIVFEYNSGLFAHKTIEKILNNYKAFITMFLKNMN